MALRRAVLTALVYYTGPVTPARRPGRGARRRRGRPGLQDIFSAASEYYTVIVCVVLAWVRAFISMFMHSVP